MNEALFTAFADRFPDLIPRFMSRAPGRVNIIGEHTDYNGYPVLPMAIDRFVTLFFAPTDTPDVEVHSIDKAYPPALFRLENTIAPSAQGEWTNYLKAAASGLVEHGLLPIPNARGIKGILGGTLPIAAGLSSSSALVVATAMALLRANNIECDRIQLATLLAQAERFVGTQGGGMDQAAILLSPNDGALKIDFFPLRIEPVPVPESAALVIAHSLRSAAKSASEMDAYNTRVVECRYAIKIVAQRLQRRFGMLIHAERPADIAANRIGLPEDLILRIAQESLGLRPWTLGEMATELCEPAEKIVEDIRRSSRLDRVVIQRKQFHLLKRFTHVVTEARRVEDSARAFRNGDLQAAGALMNASHESCAHSYEVSSKPLDKLVECGRRAGSYGSRLTGAGFGGCTVHLVDAAQVQAFMESLHRCYYAAGQSAIGKVTDGNLIDDSVLFQARPAGPASVEPLK